MLGEQADERQKLLQAQAQAFAALTVAVAVVVGCVIAVALKDPIWPFVLFGTR